VEHHHQHSEFTALLGKLNQASERKQMSVTSDHPWGEAKDSDLWLRAEDKLSIYGTPYWDLATDREKKQLSRLELASWWQGFIHFERLLSEYYMGLVNQDVFSDYPEVTEYLHHFCKEEIVHSMVFNKAMNHFGVETFNPPENFKNVYTSKFDGGKLPLTDIYLTFIVEWIADLQQRIDVQGANVSPLAATIVREHGREESRHIVFAKELIKTFGKDDSVFLEHARQFTPIFCRQFIDSGIGNAEAYERIGFENQAFQDIDALFDAIITNDNRKKINSKIMRHVMPALVDADIYCEQYHDLWVQCGFEDDVQRIRNRKKK
jgi:hypothetical protein